jgi:hypothetical protein
MNAIGNVTRTASRIYLEIIGTHMVIQREDSIFVQFVFIDRLLSESKMLVYLLWLRSEFF